MKRLIPPLVAGLLFFALAASEAVAAEFDKYQLESASVEISDTQAGAHADLTTNLQLNEHNGEAYAKTRDVVVELPPGIVGNPEAFPKCTVEQLGVTTQTSECPLDSQVGSTDYLVSGVATGTFANQPVYNMPAPGGDVVARFGFFAGEAPIFLNVRLDSETQSLIATVENASSTAELIASKFTLWGVPGDDSHNAQRLTPVEAAKNTGPPGGRESNLPGVPFMTNPTTCEGGREATVTVVSYQLPGSPRSLDVPFPQMTGCGLVNLEPTTSLLPTTTQGSSGTGLDYELNLPTKGLESANLLGGSHLKRAEVVLPEGMSINPSQAEGLGVCSQADLARETYNSAPDVGCPETSKIGTVEAITPVIDRNPTGSLYVAKPYENPFGSLIALYMVLKVPDRGVLVKLKGKVTVDPSTGQITTVFDDLPQLPFKTFRLHFREGARSPLVTPRACGVYTATSSFNPWARPGEAITGSSEFSITSGPDHGRCPSGGLPPSGRAW